MLDDMLDYLEKTRERPVWQPIPDEVRAAFNTPLLTTPMSLPEVHELFMQQVLPYTVGNTHPGFMGWVHGGGNPVGMLAEMLAAGLNANLGGRDQIPLEVERQVTAWVRDLFGFPLGASGLFVTGTSQANLIGVLVARATALGIEMRRNGLTSDRRRLVAYTSTGAHCSIAQAMDVAGLGTAALRMIDVDDLHRMDVKALEYAIAADRQQGYTPFFIAASAGTVDVGAIDPLIALAEVARRERLWLHVDGAYAALAMLAPDIAPLLAGIEQADSIAFDFHKWGQAPYDAGFILVRDGVRHEATFSAPAAYLKRATRGMAAGSPWPCDFGTDLSRGFRALKVWFALKVYGAAHLGTVISHTCTLARQLEQHIKREAELELLAPVTLNIVCFRYRCKNADRVNADIVVALQESGIVAPSTTTVRGVVAIRAAIVNHRTQAKDIDALVTATLDFGKTFT
ncbi:pyridoxal phosphate-dependent decarboxylase family protein [Candidatus Nitrotoga sp. M5]|uniref:pyridoxal phosphate-dependent decarboxylase family protein n=1 Tax=Candidatus Nitrotoga sp. M5 TaxID=2890409 RepID=UPI001EF3A5A9|nr:aminotransferase class V-fold PLP-dependent enzyme [Candidatus Nitrotoga sp. M5]CAH1386026.1 Aromatic-L-amino-acid decarboxylase [Candidatus Nitrotoga sp. M5]